MQLVIDKLGKVAVTVEESYWNIDKDYDKLTIVEKEGIFGTYISRKPVPAGTELTNRLYWIPFSSVKESIVLDYNKFLDTCKKVLDGHTEELSEHETRLTTVENNFKNHIDDTIVKFAQLDKSILDAANERGAISSKLSTVEDTAKKNKAALDILNGTGEGSISDQIADAIAEVIAGAPENLDTLKELADWIKTHGAEAATMNSKIKANETSIANIETNIDTIEKNVSDNTNDIINIKAENKETKAEVNKLKKDVSDNTTSIAVNSEKITTLEGKVATNTNDINTNASKIAKNELDIETNTAHIIALENNTINGHKISSNPVIDGSEIAVGDITTSSSTEFDNLEITKDTKINEAISSLQNKIKESTNIRSTNEFEVEADKNYKIASISNDIKTTFVLVVTATLNNSTNSYIINYNINASNTELKVHNSYISSGDVEDLILSVVFNSYDLNIKFNKAVKFTATFINFEYNILKVPTVVEDITSYSELTYIIDFYPNKVYFEGKEVTADKFIKKGGTSTEVLYADGSAKEIKEPTPLNPTIPSVENIVAFDDMPFNSTNTDVIKNAIGILKKLDVRPYSEHCEEITLQKITGTFQLFELNSSSDYFDTDCIFEIYRNVNDKPNLTWYVKFRILIENNNVFYDILDVSYGLSILNWMSIYKTQNSYKIVFNQHGQVYNDDYKIFIKQTTSHNNYFTTNVIYNIDYSTTEGAELIYNQIDLRNKTNNIDFRNIPNTTINNYIDHKKIKLSDKYTKIATIENINFNNSIDIDTVLKFTYFKNNSYGEEDISTNYNSKTNTFLLHIHKKSEEDFDIDNLKVLCDVLENNSNNIRLRIVYNGDKIDIYAERLKDDLYYGNNYKIDVIHYSSNFKLLDEYETFNHITGTILCSTEESTDSTIIKTPIKFKQLSIENGTSEQLIAGDGSLVPIRQTISISGPTVMGIILDKYKTNHANSGNVISIVFSINNPTHSAINKPRIERLAFDISFYDNLTSSSYSKIKVKLVDLKYTNYYDITNDSANIEFYYFWSDSVFHDTSLYIKFNGINEGSYDVVSNGYKIYRVSGATIQTKIDTINLPSYPNIPNGTIIDLNYPLLSNELIITNPSNPTQNPNIIDTSFFTEYNALKTKVDSIDTTGGSGASNVISGSITLPAIQEGETNAAIKTQQFKLCEPIVVNYFDNSEITNIIGIEFDLHYKLNIESVNIDNVLSYKICENNVYISGQYEFAYIAYNIFTFKKYIDSTNNKYYYYILLNNPGVENANISYTIIDKNNTIAFTSNELADLDISKLNNSTTLVQTIEYPNGNYLENIENKTYIDTVPRTFTNSRIAHVEDKFVMTNGKFADVTDYYKFYSRINGTKCLKITLPANLNTLSDAKVINMTLYGLVNNIPLNPASTEGHIITKLSFTIYLEPNGSGTVNTRFVIDDLQYKGHSNIGYIKVLKDNGFISIFFTNVKSICYDILSSYDNFEFTSDIDDTFIEENYIFYRKLINTSSNNIKDLDDVNIESISFRNLPTDTQTVTINKSTINQYNNTVTKVSSMPNMVILTQAEYNDLTTKDENTLYFIKS